MLGKFEITKAIDQTYAYSLRADNGLVILTSPACDDKAKLLRSIEAVRRNALSDERFERLASAQGQPYFNLRSAEGQVLGRSQVYSSTSAMENGIASVGRNGPNAVLVDMALDMRQVISR